MFYRYEHYMSISHIPLIVNMAHSVYEEGMVNDLTCQKRFGESSPK